MKLSFTSLTGAFLLLALACPASAQDESKEDLVKRLKGQSGATASRGLTSRGLKSRSLSPSATPAASSETRSLYFSTRGIPKAVQAAAEEDRVKITTTTAPSSNGAGQYPVAAGEAAVQVNYTVDPESKVARDNILFRKGSADFADDASVEVVVTLAEALKNPELAGLQYVIEGHASAEGDASSNQSLSQERAEQIVAVLTSLGVSHDRLLPVGFGETQARFADHSPEALLKQDRRVLIYRLDH
ncbi:MAG: OmpA family protein [Verrucomicrobiales bacterium]|jgi:outer membrane protein OmpA-like peptidoglycan-associated protein|nr:OmpA family protein [Verrucomicrobiales bacterium]MBP9225239.1 OmpA family protein [Verrucomicrobiales bacterium]